MKKILVTLLFGLFVFIPAMSQYNLDSLYKELDRAIADTTKYMMIREKRIEEKKMQLKYAESLHRQFDLNKSLFDEYHAYINDSAIHYIDNCIRIATAMKDEALVAECRSLLAFQCSTTGMYTESAEILHEIEDKSLPRDVRQTYFLAWNHLYWELAFYTKIPRLHHLYIKKAGEYENRIFNETKLETEAFYIKKSLMYYGRGNLTKAMKLNDLLLSKVRKGSEQYAVITFYRSLIYGRMGNEHMQCYWLAESALSDVRNAVMDQGSMWELANILNHYPHQLQRSYQYIGFAWQAAQKFGTRVRSRQIVPVLSSIDSNYKVALNKTNDQLRFTIAIVSVLSLLLLVLLYYVNRERKLLAQANKQIKDTVEELKESNTKLSKAIGHLNESNKMKEEYVGRFMRLCSVYIDKTDTLRRKVAKGLKNKDYADLEKLTKSGEKDLNDFYQLFDTSFLNLFPNFVSDFNSLLKPDFRIEIPDMNELNTTIRIFALIRLGIEDSSKIAEFLHYSVNTIYNYRAQIKNGAIGNREDFERDVKNIGMSE